MSGESAIIVRLSFVFSVVIDIFERFITEITLKTKDDNSKIYIQTTDKVDIDLSAYAKAKINFSTNIEEE